MRASSASSITAAEVDLAESTMTSPSAGRRLITTVKFRRKQLYIHRRRFQRKTHGRPPASFGFVRRRARLVKSRGDHRIRRNSNGVLVFCDDHVFIAVGFARLIVAVGGFWPVRVGDWLE